jgi:hypothetical protein
MDLIESRYEALHACFNQYAKLKIIVDFFPKKNYKYDFIKLESLIHILEDRNLRFFYLKKNEFEIKEKIKNTSNVSEMEKMMVELSNIENEIKNLNKVPEDYPFTLEESLTMFDFFETYSEKIRE